MSAIMVSDVKEEFRVKEEETSSFARGRLLSPGTTSRRINNANPLKDLAHLLQRKLIAAYGAPCNLLQVALEVHSQAQDKRNTTLRRIYDVVNVCEGAGVLSRTGPKPSDQLKEITAAASDQTLQLQRSEPPLFRRTGKKSLKGGAAIQWIGASSDKVVGDSGLSPAIRCKNQKLLLQVEKGQIVDRMLQKRRVCDTLSKQVAILQKLVEQNQAQCRLHENAAGSMSSEEAKFLADMGVPVSMEEENSNISEVASESSCGDHDIYTPLSYLGGYCFNEDYLMCDSFEDFQELPYTARRLHLPFVMLATHPDANVEICITGDPPYQVHLQLDRSYCLMDHIQMIKMLPEERGEKIQ